MRLKNVEIISRREYLSRIRSKGFWLSTIALPLLMADEAFASKINACVPAWRRVVVMGAQAGIPLPAFGSSLSYFDGLRAERLPAALIQGQRDFFGAHTYKRVDKEGVFHTLWSGDRSEIETTPSSH